MYRHNNGHFSGQHRQFGGDHRNGGGRRRFGGFRKQRPSFRDNIDERMYVRKAVEFKKIEEVATEHSFEDFGLNDQLLNNIKAKGFVKPTAIQDKVISEVINGRDVLGIANTGTGKTAAFAIPLINRILANPNERVIIISPTRELALQIKEEFRSFTPGLKVYMALATGGAYMRDQIMDIKRGPNIIIGTAGRITDLGKRRIIRFDQMSTVVLDEVDRMLDMGFVDEIKSIMNQIPASRQTLFFSATINKKIEALIDTLLNNPVKVSVKTADASTHVEQNIVKVNRSNKKETLVSLLKQEELKKVLIFGETKLLVDEITTTLQQNGFSVDAIHGDKPQFVRKKVLNKFKFDEISILVATDVAARGLDIADITHVINYSKPNNYDDYIHRIGRTGRGDKKGYALTFVESRF